MKKSILYFCHFLSGKTLISALVLITISARVNAQTVTANTVLDENNGITTGITNFYVPAGGVSVNMNTSVLAINGQSKPHNNMIHYLTFNFCIAPQGVFPPRT